MILTIEGNNGVSILRNILPKVILPLLGPDKQSLRIIPFRFPKNSELVKMKES